MRIPVALIALCVSVIACSDPSSALPPEPEGLPCVPSQSVSGGPAPEPGGPYYHQVAIGQTADGASVTGAAQVLDHASGPDGVQLGSGTVLVYYINGEDGAVWVARLENGRLRELTPITVNGISAPEGVTDPDAQLLPNGDVRLTYLGGTGAASAENPYAICIADSDDGARFTVRSVAVLLAPSANPVTDPSVVRLPDQSWLMATSQGQRTIFSRSTDGYHFTRDTSFAFGSIPEIALLSTGALRVFVCTQNGIAAHQSANGGRTWTFERTLVAAPFNGKPTVCDPSIVTGAGLFVFKTAG